MNFAQKHSGASETSARLENHLPDPVTVRLSTTLQCAGDGVIVTDLDQRIEFLNPTAEAILGIKSDSAEGRQLLDVLHLEEIDGRRVRGSLVELATISEAPIDLGKSLVLVPYQGNAKQVEGEICARVSGGAAVGSVITFRDVTARNWEELQRREEQKVRGLGKLAGAIAHELNNLLTTIVGQREAIEDLYPESVPLRRSTAEIQKATDGVAAVARQLLTISGRQLVLPKLVNLSRLLKDVMPRIMAMMSPAVEVSFTLEKDPYAVFIDPVPMTQAILSLAEYCRERMPQGGKIDIIMSNVIIDRNQRARHLRRFVEIALEDTGPSLKGVTIETLFEPSWTAELGRPVSLGLYTIGNIISAARGHLSLETARETGAKFRLLLPEAEGISEVADSDATAGVPKRKTILLVEDDDAIRILLRNSMEKRGYKVIEARDGSEALLQSEMTDGVIDLLVTDVVMPLMNGPAVARSLSKSRPGIQLLLISGCPEDRAEIEELIHQGAQFAQKPFSQRELLGQIDSMLGENRI